MSVLRQIHDDLDAAVAEAYGWPLRQAQGGPVRQAQGGPVDLSDDEILRRLVELNAQRADEERRGIVRWLRPEFQNPTGSATAQGALALPAATAPTGKKATPKRAPWPKGLADQARAVRAALQSRGRPTTPEELARTFARAPVDKVTDLLETLAAFNGANGTMPQGSVALDAAGNLYGTTEGGGANNSGTVFEIAKGSNTITTLASAPSADGGVTIDAAGNLYGIIGGPGGGVFELAKGSNTRTIVAAFDGTNGRSPTGPLTLDSSGNLYGTTQYGGPNGGGTVFEIASSSNRITTICGFGSQVQMPVGGITFDSSGDIFGNALLGGPAGDGGVFEIPSGTNTAKLIAYVFEANGSAPQAQLAVDASGNLFGTAYVVPGDNKGGVFEIPKGSSTVTTLAGFNGTNGAQPDSGVLLDGAGNIYGLTYIGGSNNVGAVFELAANTAVTLAPAGGPNPSHAGRPVTFTATVTGGVPDGETVTIVDASNNNAVVATGTLSGGSATLTVPAGALSPGIHNLVAAYGGDANFAASESAAYAQDVLPAWLAAGSQATWNASTHTLTVTGSATIIADPGSDEPNVVESGSSAKLLIRPATSPTDVHVGGISLSNGASLQMVSLGSARTHANHNVLVVGTLGAASNPTFAIDGSSKLDLSDNDLILHVGSSDANGTAGYATVFAAAKSGRGGSAGAPDGTWNGSGLDSSAANSADTKAGYEQIGLAVVVNNQLINGTLSKWTVGSAGENLAAGDVIVKYDYLGDYALEGYVGTDDAAILQGEYDNGTDSTHSWATGASTFDGLCDTNEAAIFQGQYGLGTGGSNGEQL